MKCIRTSGRPGALRRLSRGSYGPLWRPDSRSSSSSIADAHSAASRACSRVACGRSAGASTAPRASLPAAAPARTQPRAASAAAPRSPPPAASARSPRLASRVFTSSVPSRVSRAGHACRAISAPTAAGHAATVSPMRPAAPKRASSLRELVAERLHHAASLTTPAETSSSWSGSAGSIAASVAVMSAWPTPATRAARIRRRSGSSSDRTSSSRSSGGDAAAIDDQLGLGEEEREHGETLLALRAVAAQLARPDADDDVVEVRTETGHAALEVAVEHAPRAPRAVGGSPS